MIGTVCFTLGDWLTMKPSQKKKEFEKTHDGIQFSKTAYFSG